jgi:cob(I)alamin adenosyltransferase
MEFDALHAFVGTGAAPSAAREAILKEPEGGVIVEDDTDELAILAGRYAVSQRNSRRFALTIVTPASAAISTARVATRRSIPRSRRCSAGGDPPVARQEAQGGFAATGVARPQH